MGFTISQERLLLTTKYGVFYVPGRRFPVFLGEGYELDNILPRLLDGARVFVDVGAFLGLYTVASCRRVERVIAVEPNPYTLPLLKVNVSMNCNNVEVIDKAIASYKGFTELKIPPEDPVVSIATIMRWDFAYPFYKVRVKADTLDNILADAGVNRADVIKVDIEGAEGIAFEGMRETLKEAKAVIMEIWPENIWIIREMKNMGYKIANIIDYGYKNYIFIRA